MGIALIKIRMLHTLLSCFACPSYICTVNCFLRSTVAICSPGKSLTVSKEVFILEDINPYPTAFPYGNGMVLHFYQQQESSTTKTVHRVINKGLKTYV